MQICQLPSNLTGQLVPETGLRTQARTLVT